MAARVTCGLTRYVNDAQTIFQILSYAGYLLMEGVMDKNTDELKQENEKLRGRIHELEQTVKNLQIRKALFERSLIFGRESQVGR